ncbi:MAG: type II toxin-antitoxin system RelE/ParE family toxin [Hyphomicrobiales bacterium]
MPLGDIKDNPRIFATRAFIRQNKKIGLTNAALCKAIREIVAGLNDGSLGIGVFKKRIALDGRGKRGSARTLIATRVGLYWFYLFAFKKNDRSDLSPQEYEALMNLADDLYALNENGLAKALGAGALIEVQDDDTEADG